MFSLKIPGFVTQTQLKILPTCCSKYPPGYLSEDNNESHETRFLLCNTASGHRAKREVKLSSAVVSGLNETFINRLQSSFLH